MGFRCACAPSRIRRWRPRAPCLPPRERRSRRSSARDEIAVTGADAVTEALSPAGESGEVRRGDAAGPRAASRSLGSTTHKLWGGRFAGGPAPALEAVNRSIATDFRLWPFDIRLSKAWAVALWNAGVLSIDESRRIEAGLDAVGERFAGGAA